MKYSSTVQPKCLSMNCIHTHIHACLHIFTCTQTQITRAQTFTHAYKHGCTHTKPRTHSTIYVKVKVNFSLEHATSYSCTLSLTSALDGVVGQRHAPAALPPGNTRYSLYRRLVGPQGWYERVRKISPPPIHVHKHTHT